MTLRVSVCGIDGSGKSTSVSDVVKSLSEDYSVLRVGRPTYYEYRGKREYLFSRATETIDRLHAFFDRMHIKKGILIANAVNVLLQPSLENYLMENLNPDIAIAGRDMVICPAVYLSYYLQVSVKIPMDQRMSMFNAIRLGGYPNLVIYLDIDPEVANGRISERIRQEEGKAVDRAKWRHFHENPHDLATLRKNYQDAVAIVRSLGVNCVAIETTYKCREQVVQEIKGSIENLLLQKS